MTRISVRVLYKNNLSIKVNMILFAEDWDKYPKAIPDTMSSNKSWVNMAGILKSMGCKNYCFHLALHDPDLQGVDPFAEQMSPMMVMKIQLEIKNNPWYFFREIARLPNGNNPLQFRLSRPILALYWSIFNNITFCLVMPRQIGKTAAMALIHSYLRDYKYRGSITFLFTKDTKLRKDTVTDMKAIQDLYPVNITTVTKFGANRDLDNYETVTCNKWANSTKTDVGHEVKLAAENVGRGGKYKFAHSDETAWTVNSHLSIPQIQFAMGAARENAAPYGEICCDVYTTTPGYLDTPHGSYAYDLIMSGMYWNEIVYDCANPQEAKELIKTNSPSGKCIINGTFNHRQAGKTDAWLLERIENTTTDIERIENNLLNKWSKGSLSMLLTKQQIEIITKSVIPHVHSMVSTDRYIFDWWINKHDIDNRLRNGHFGLGLDTSNIVGKDANGLVLMDFKDLSVVARSRVTEGNLFTYGRWIASILIAYPTITLIIENKASGQSMLDTIAYELIAVGINPFRRIYNKVVDKTPDNTQTRDKDLKFIEDNWREQKTYDSFKALFGISTTQSSRQFLYNTVIQEALSSTGHVINDVMLVEELCGLIEKNGRADHPRGGHDDLVMGWMLVHWFIKHSRNLQYYGIDTNYSLSRVADNGAVLTEDELRSIKVVNDLREEVTKLKDAIKASSSVIENTRDERVLGIKVAELKRLGDNSLSMDSILSEIADSKSNKRSIRQTMLNLHRKRGTSYYR